MIEGLIKKELFVIKKQSNPNILSLTDQIIFIGIYIQKLFFILNSIFSSFFMCLSLADKQYCIFSLEEVLLDHHLLNSSTFFDLF